MKGPASTVPGRKRGAQVDAALVEAYQTVFGGEAGRMVLIDLAHHCKVWENVSISPGIDNSDVLVDFNARRSVYGRILQFVRLTGEELQALDRAAAEERRADLEQGAI